MSKLKKANLKDREMLALEDRLVREGKIYPRAHYMPRGRFRGILAVCLAFFFGIFLLIGGVIGVGIYFGSSKKVKDIFSLFGMSEEEYLQYIDGKYAEMSVLELVDDITKNDFKSLRSVTQYSPFVKQKVSELLTQFSDVGISLDLNALLDAPFETIGDFIYEQGVMQAELGKVMKVNGSSPAILLALCYGEENLDYQIAEGGEIIVIPPHAPVKVGDLNDNEAMDQILGSIRLGSILELNRKDVSEDTIKSNAAMYALAYGKYGVDYHIGYDTDGNAMIVCDDPLTLADLMPSDDGGSVSLLDDLELGSLLGIDIGVDVNSEEYKNNSAMYGICYGVLGVDFEITEEGYVRMLDGHDEMRPVTVSALQNDSTNLIQTLEIEALLGTPDQDSSDIMYYVLYGTADHYEKTVAADGSVTVTMKEDPATGLPYRKNTGQDLSDDEFVKEMKISDIIPADENSSGIIKAIQDMTIDQLNDPAEVEKLKLGDVLDVKEGDSSLMLALKDKSIAELKDQDTLNDLKIGDILGDTEDTSSLMRAIEDWKVSDLKNENRINRLHISDVIGGEGDSNLMKAIGSWRIGDLSKQDKVDSLTLADVIDIGDETTGILAALKNTPIGEIGSRVETLRLSEIMDESELAGNKILKHLADSTLDTLADDVQALTIGEVFGNQVYSYMAIETRNGERVDYEWLESQYFGETDGKANYLNEKYNKDDPLYRPTALPSGDLYADDGTPKFTTTLYIDSEKVTPAYFYDKEGNSKVTEGVTVHYDASIAQSNRLPEAVQKTPYYAEETIKLTPVYEYSVYDYKKGEVSPDRHALEDRGGTLFFDGHEVTKDAYGDYSYLDANGDRVDLEPTLVGYTAVGGEVTLERDGEGKLTGNVLYNGQSYKVSGNAITLRREVYELYVNEAGEVKNGTVKETYMLGDQELDRYLSGVWYLLLIETDEDGNVIGNKTDTPILDVDGLITGVSSSMQDSTFAELWFHELLQDNPYASLVIPNIFPNGITFKRKLPDGSTKEDTATNLIEIRLSETVALVRALSDELTLLSGKVPGFGG